LANEFNARLIFWEIVAIIHTFAGSVLINSAVSKANILSNNWFWFALGLFLANLIVIGRSYNWKKKDFRIFFEWKKYKITIYNIEFAFIVSIATLFIFADIILPASMSIAQG
jgi:hypothetical protein